MTVELEVLYATKDAAVWAEAFIETQRTEGCDPTDFGWVVGWFANAMETAAGLTVRPQFDASIERLSHDAVLGAVARGWCAPENAAKTMDVDLATAIAHELMVLIHLGEQD